MNRFEQAIQGEEYDSEYDIADTEIDDLVFRAPNTIKVISSIDFSQAGTLQLNEPGYGFVFYAKSKASGLKYSEAYLQAFVNEGDATNLSVAFPAKHGRGFIGSFKSLFLKWPQQNSDTYTVNFVIFKSMNLPWQGGEEAT